MTTPLPSSRSFTRISTVVSRQRSKRLGFSGLSFTSDAPSALRHCNKGLSNVSCSSTRTSFRRCRQRSKRFHPTLPRLNTSHNPITSPSINSAHTDTEHTHRAELGTLPLLSRESAAHSSSTLLHRMQPSSSSSSPSSQFITNTEHTCAEPGHQSPLLSIESVAHINPEPFRLPHSNQFRHRHFPPRRPNTDPRANTIIPLSPEPPRVPSRLNADAWEYFLADYPDRQLVSSLLHIIRFGANLGFTGNRFISQTCSNLPSALAHPDAVSSDVNLMIGMQCTRGPFPCTPFPNFRSSPLGVAIRKHTGKKRRIHHLSWPPGSSVNDGIADSEAAIDYESFRLAVQDLVRSGPGSLMVKLDLEQAFRHIPVRQADWHLLGFTWADQLYHDITLGFGCRSAPYIFNLFAEALHWILDHHLPALIRHYLDDFLQIYHSSLSISTINHALEWSLALGSCLGLRFQPSKIEGPSTQLEFLGIILDSDKMEARLPPTKLSFLSTLLSSWHTRTRCKLRELQELLGFLQFCSQVIPYSKAFLRALFDFSSKFSSPFVTRTIPRLARRDITWWCRFSTSWNGIHFISPSRPSISIFTDASGSKGAGGIFDAKWFSIRIPPRYMKRDIQFKELYAIVHAILCWGPSFSGKHIIFNIDNQADFSALQNLSIRSAPTMELLRNFLMLACQLDFTFESNWIPTEMNPLADAASRFQFARLFELAPYLSRKTSPKILSIPNLDFLPNTLHPPLASLL